MPQGPQRSLKSSLKTLSNPPARPTQPDPPDGRIAQKSSLVLSFKKEQDLLLFCKKEAKNFYEF
jgi:hypothetical protein